MSIESSEIIGEPRSFQQPPQNINYINLTPSDLELKLVVGKNESFYVDVTLHFKEKYWVGIPKSSSGTIHIEGTTPEKALEEYSLILEKIEKSNYKLNAYSHGHIDIEFGE